MRIVGVTVVCFKATWAREYLKEKEVKHHPGTCHSPTHMSFLTLKKSFTKGDLKKDDHQQTYDDPSMIAKW